MVASGRARRACAYLALSRRGVVRRRDSQRILSADLMGYARSFMENDADSATFLCKGPQSSLLRVFIGRSAGKDDLVEMRLDEIVHPWGLTFRELEVLSLIVCGMTNPEIAGTLEITVRTVSSHIEHILNRTDQTTRSALSALAVDQGLILLPLPEGDFCPPNLTVFRLERRLRSAGCTRRRTDGASRFPRLTPAPLRIGAIVPDSCQVEADDMLSGIQIAQEETNARGGIDGRMIEHASATGDVFDVTSMRTSLRTLADQGIDALVFGYSMDYVNIGSFLEAASDLKVPVIHASTSSRAINYVEDNPASLGSVFHICGGDALYGPGFTRFLENIHDRIPDSGGRRLAVISAPPGMEVFGRRDADRACCLGWHITSIGREESVSGPAERWRIVRALEDCQPDVVLAPTFLDETLLMSVLRWRQGNPRRPVVFSHYTPSIAGFLERAGALSEGLVWATQTGTYGDRFGSSFRARFSERFGREPGYSQASVQYDTVNLLVRAWKDVRNPLDSSAVVASLRQVVHRGVNGSYWLGGKGQAPLTLPDHTLDASVAQAQLIFQVQGGCHRIIGPSPYTEALFRR